MNVFDDRTRGNFTAILILTAFVAGAFQQATRAGDWPQILGPQRNGRAEDEQLLNSWAADGPKSLWSRRVGSGFAGPTVVSDRVIVFHRVGDNERIEALDATNGERIWKTDFAASYAGGINRDTGPRCTPVVHDGHVYVFGAAGDVHCVSSADGTTRWSRSAFADYGAPEGYFGAGSSPIVADGKLLVNVGARGAGLVAFALDTGKTVWKATDELASYSSPALTTIGGRDRAIFVTRLNTVLVDPQNGDAEVLFPFGKRGPTVNAATPLVFDGHLFVTASYGVGATLAKLNDSKAETVWSNDDVMSCQYTTCVYDDGFLYGTDGREDIGRATLRCIDARTGHPQWSVEDFGCAHIILTDGKLLIQTVDGTLMLAEASPRQFKKLAEVRISDDITRALPALSNGRYLFRTNERDDNGQLKCLQVGQIK